MLRGGELTRLTRDHTYGQLVIEAGIIRPDELGSDPQHSSFIARWLDGKSGASHGAGAMPRTLGIYYRLPIMPPYDCG